MRARRIELGAGMAACALRLLAFVFDLFRAHRPRLHCGEHTALPQKSPAL